MTKQRSIAARLGRALRRSPRYLVRRAIDSARRRHETSVVVRLPADSDRPRLLARRRRARHRTDCGIDLAAQPFFILSAERARSFPVHFWPSTRRRRRDRAGRRRRAAPRIRSARVRPAAARTPLPWHTDFKTGREWPLAVLHRHRIQRARSADRRQGAVGAQPLSALHRARPGVLADRRRAVRRGVRRRDRRTGSRANPLSLRRELGVRDGRRAARRQLDLGLLFLCRLGGLPRSRRSAPLSRVAVPPWRVRRHASRAGRRQRQPLSVRRRRPGLSRLLLPATADGPPRGSRSARRSSCTEIFNQTTRRRRRLRAVDRLPPAGARSVSDQLPAAAIGTANRCPAECWARLERMCEFVAGVHQARRPRAAHRRRRRRPGAEARDAGDQRPSVSAVERRVAVRPGRLQGVGGPMLGGVVLAARRRTRRGSTSRAAGQ